MTRRSGRGASNVLFATMLVLGALVPSSVGAGTNCEFDEGSGLLTYSLGGSLDDDDGVVFTRDPLDDSIAIYSGIDRFARVGCMGEPTVTNVDKIVVEAFGDAPAAFKIGIDLSGGPFAPGKTDEPGSSNEIEFELALPHSAAENELRITGGSAADRFTFGTAGINLNPNEKNGRDVDVDLGTAPNRYQIFTVVGGSGTDVVDTRGGAATGAGWPFAMTFYMGEGNDVFRYGVSNENLVFGGRGRDTLDFRAADDGIEVHLEIPSADYNGEFHEVEKLIGSSHGDILKGDDAANRIKGGRGNDVLRGRGGNDFIDGAKDHDYCSGGPGVDEVVNCEES